MSYYRNTILIPPLLIVVAAGLLFSVALANESNPQDPDYYQLPRDTSSFWKLGDPLVPCGTRASSYAACDYNALIKLIQNLIAFMLWLAAPVATLLFAYAGFLYLTAGDNASRVETAHTIFRDAIIGIVVMLIAFLVVYLITNTLTNNTSILKSLQN